MIQPTAQLTVKIAEGEHVTFEMTGPAQHVIPAAAAWQDAHKPAAPKPVHGVGFATTERKDDTTPHELDGEYRPDSYGNR